MCRYRAGIWISLLGWSCAVQALPEPSANDFGGLGLLQTPSARFAADGEFRAGISSALPYNQLFVGLQWLPWLETGIRYTEVTNRLYGPVEFSGNQTYKDRGVDLKMHLLSEGAVLPDVALGFRDIGGTGLFSSEYLVASKRYYDLDFSLGLGWGRLGSRGGIKNPFRAFGSRFDERPQNGPGGAGLDRLFAGPEISPFGGVEWKTPVKNLSLKLEYDGNDFQSEALSNNQVVHSPVNVALNYRYADALDLSVGLERGDTFMFRVSAFTGFQTNFGPPKVLDPPATPAYRQLVPVAPSSTDDPAPIPDPFGEAIRAELLRQGFVMQAVEWDEAKGLVRVWFSQNLTRSQPRAIGRVAQTLAMLAPPQFHAFTLIDVAGDSESYRVTVFRKDVQNAINFRGSPEEIRARALVEPPVPYLDATIANKDLVKFPEGDWEMGPALRQHVGGPDDFYFGQLWWRVAGTAALSRRLSVSSAVGFNIYNNFDGLKVESNSVLPHVRSDIVEYLQEGKNNLVRLEANYIWSPAPSWHARLSAGVFEEMYGGVAGEVLYREAYSPWAVGLNVNRVRQRDYDQRFDFRDYEVTTGNLTGYFDLPFYDLHMNLSVGQYLAGDRGATMELSRQFASGVVAGAFATKTNVSAVEFGEGRFDKGFFISLPLDLFFARSTKKISNFTFRPLTRDGGQKVRDGYSLYEAVDRDHRAAEAQWPDALR